MTKEEQAEKVKEASTENTESVVSTEESTKAAGGSEGGASKLEPSEKAEAIWAKLASDHDEAAVQAFRDKTNSIMDEKIGQYLQDAKKGAQIQEVQADIAQDFFGENGGDKDLEPAMINMFSHSLDQILKD